MRPSESRPKTTLTSSNIKTANGKLSCLGLYHDQELPFTCILTVKIKGKKSRNHKV